MKSTRFNAAGAAIRTAIAAILLTLTTASGSGCGQRGPLYLPEAEPGAGGQPETGSAEAQPELSGEPGTGETPEPEDSR
jgi:predicted small lipoprotein YifL